MPKFGFWRESGSKGWTAVFFFKKIPKHTEAPPWILLLWQGHFKYVENPNNSYWLNAVKQLRDFWPFMLRRPFCDVLSHFLLVMRGLLVYSMAFEKAAILGPSSAGQGTSFSFALWLLSFADCKDLLELVPCSFLELFINSFDELCAPFFHFTRLNASQRRESPAMWRHYATFSVVNLSASFLSFPRPSLPIPTIPVIYVFKARGLGTLRSSRLVTSLSFQVPWATFYCFSKKDFF